MSPWSAIADGRRGWRWMILMGLLTATGLAVLWHPLSGLIATVSNPFTRGRRTGGSPDGCPRRRSERLVSELLTHLPGDHILVNDVALPNRQDVIDHIVIGPCGVVVIEPRQDAAETGGAGAVCAVREFLAERHPDLRRSGLRFVDSVVVFTDARSPLEIYRARSAVVRYSELLQFIGALARQRAMDGPTAAAIARTLTAVSAPPAQPGRQSSVVALATSAPGFRSI